MGSRGKSVCFLGNSPQPKSSGARLEFPTLWSQPPTPREKEENPPQWRHHKISFLDSHSLIIFDILTPQFLSNLRSPAEGCKPLRHGSWAGPAAATSRSPPLPLSSPIGTPTPPPDPKTIADRARLDSILNPPSDPLTIRSPAPLACEHPTSLSCSFFPLILLGILMDLWCPVKIG